MSGQPLFPASHASRVERAREQFFAQGLRPSGLVPEAVIQSWMRCLQQGRGERDTIAFEPVTRSRVHGTLRRHGGLLQAAAPSLERLEAALGGTGCRLLLTSGDGVVIHAGHAPAPEADMPVLRAAARVGVDLSERAAGTNAPALVVATGRSVAVNGGEHFHHVIRGVSCAAAPIHDRRGELAGVLDLSIESRPFGFDAAALIGPFALAIENRLLLAQAHEELVLVLQSDPGLFETPLAGLVGVGEDGRLAWCNGMARRLLQATPGDAAEACLGQTVVQLEARSGASAQLLPLPSGLVLWCEVRAPGRAQPEVQALAAEQPPHAGDEAADAATSSSALSDSRRELIRRALQAHGGNIARTARALQVSRGLVYRALRGDA
jgi:transcriptional regulator of acetoin/glycerol metabolism